MRGNKFKKADMLSYLSFFLGFRKEGTSIETGLNEGNFSIKVSVYKYGLYSELTIQ